MPLLEGRFENQAQVDAQYNPALRIADAAAELRHHAERSALARQQLEGRLGVSYGPTRAEKLDVFPARQPGSPVFVFIHGGYWRALSAGDFSYTARGPHRRGHAAVVLDYALCPWVTIDEIVRQVRAALAWVWRHAETFNGDRERIVIAGHSAGGQLGAMALHTDWAGDYGLPVDPLRAAWLASGLYELSPLRWSYLQPLIQLDDRTIARQSPMHTVRPCATPLKLVWGDLESEEFARQSTEHAARWQAAGNRVEAEALAGLHHHSVVHALEDPDSAACDWLDRQARA
ncbi:alpha/beta hydrolase [Leptothrix discophora]|uniref:Alpha/beta hydrolase n=1 Tax=Leptothrix discophora TaxID=89 RepID=A0ABT9FYA8_LEPDI|nr:alpha/beta hydrolase [Leptothrix discophora]MDP4299209.1 alpha/beta hydrolase [Leptothrix discophora]